MIDQLPRDALIQVFHHLTPKQLLHNIAPVNRNLYEFITVQEGNNKNNSIEDVNCSRWWWSQQVITLDIAREYVDSEPTSSSSTVSLLLNLQFLPRMNIQHLILTAIHNDNNCTLLTELLVNGGQYLNQLRSLTLSRVKHVLNLGQLAQLLIFCCQNLEHFTAYLVSFEIQSQKSLNGEDLIKTHTWNQLNRIHWVKCSISSSPFSSSSLENNFDQMDSSSLLSLLISQSPNLKQIKVDTSAQFPIHNTFESITAQSNMNQSIQSITLINVSQVDLSQLLQTVSSCNNLIELKLEQIHLISRSEPLQLELNKGLTHLQILHLIGFSEMVLNDLVRLMFRLCCNTLLELKLFSIDKSSGQIEHDDLNIYNKMTLLTAFETNYYPFRDLITVVQKLPSLEKLIYMNQQSGDIIHASDISSFTNHMNKVKYLSLSHMCISDKNWLLKLIFQLPKIEHVEIGTMVLDTSINTSESNASTQNYMDAPLMYLDIKDSRISRSTDFSPVLMHSPYLSHLSLSYVNSTHLTLISKYCPNLKSLKLKMAPEINAQQVPIYPTSNTLRDLQIRPHPKSTMRDILRALLVFWDAKSMLVLSNLRYSEQIVQEARLYAEQQNSQMETESLTRQFLIEQIPLVIQHLILFPSEQDQTTFKDRYMRWLRRDKHNSQCYPPDVAELIEFTNTVFKHTKHGNTRTSRGLWI